MKKTTFISVGLIGGLALSACATTNSAAKIEVRPITTNSSPAERQNFNAITALDEAQELQRSSDYDASYNAYSVLYKHIGSQNTPKRMRADTLLGLADSSLSLSWRGDMYQIQAQELYAAITDNINSSENHRRRAKSGALLLDFANLKPAKAEKALRSALKDSPDDHRLWNALGKLHDGHEKWLDALDAYVQALTIAKNSGSSTSAIVNNMGMSLLMQGRKKEALAKFKQANMANPDMPVYNNNLRLAQTLLGKTDKALKGLSETRTAQVYNDAGVIAEARGELGKARSLYMKALEISPVYFELAEKNLVGLISDTHGDKANNTPA